MTTKQQLNAKKKYAKEDLYNCKKNTRSDLTITCSKYSKLNNIHLINFDRLYIRSGLFTISGNRPFPVKSC